MKLLGIDIIEYELRESFIRKFMDKFYEIKTGGRESISVFSGNIEEINSSKFSKISDTIGALYDFVEKSKDEEDTSPVPTLKLQIYDGGEFVIIMFKEGCLAGQYNELILEYQLTNFIVGKDAIIDFIKMAIFYYQIILDAPDMKLIMPNICTDNVPEHITHHTIPNPCGGTVPEQGINPLKEDVRKNDEYQIDAINHMKKIISKRINKAVKHGKYSCKIWHSNKDECLPLDMIRSLLNKNNTIVLTMRGNAICSITVMWTTCDEFNMKKGGICWHDILGGPYHEVSFEEFETMLPALPLIYDGKIYMEGKN